ncbi:unnamed protein product [Zymoseptoria tritici ST99CH_3D7]|uniref:HMG box domain-containing protein n=1 Tax=Zymoseptoria tritici (strain ST99CH_3D7) TaxID=1276538 RepID=A0A1X7RK75_ZYMT9|nr:unnamed protein product [Zymoseptoria tritici ST99CH_3D7]
MEHNFSNGPNGWGNYGGTNMYDSDTDTSNATDQLMMNVDNNDWEINGEPLDDADFALLMASTAGAPQPQTTFMGPVDSNNEYVLNVPQPGPPPPPLQAVWDSATSTWVYPVPVPQQQQQQQPYAISRAPFQAYDTQLPFRQFQDVGQNAANNAAAPKPQPKHNGKRAKKVSLAQGCACQTNAEEHTKRPMNNFMLYRQHVQKAVEKQLKKNQDSTNLSKVIGAMWVQLPPQTRKYWTDLADEVKLKHAERHPHYKYKPGGKNDKKWGSEECTCGAYEANEAKRERVEAESESEASSQRVTKQPKKKTAKKVDKTNGGFNVNYGIPVPEASRKRKASFGELQSTPKRIAGSSRSGQPQLMLEYTNDHHQTGQFGDYSGESSMNVQSDTTQGYFAQSMAAGNGYDTSFGPFATNQHPGTGYGRDMLPEEMPFDFSNTDVEGGEMYGYPSPFSTRPRETVLSARPQNPADFQLTPMAQMFATGDLANGNGLSTELGDDFWNIDNPLDIGGDWNMQQGQGTDADRTPTQASFTRRSTRLSAQKGNSAESATSPTRRLRSQGKA